MKKYFYISLMLFLMVFSLETMGAEANKCSLTGDVKFLEASDLDVIPPKLFKCNEKGEQQSAGEKICLRQFFCARTKGNKCQDINFLQAANIILGKDGKVEKYQKVNLGKALEFGKKNNEKHSLHKLCTEKKLLHIKAQEDCLCSSDQCADLKNTDFGLLSAVVFKRDYDFTNDADVVAQASNGARHVEYRYLTSEQEKRLFSIINYEETADGEYCVSTADSSQFAISKLVFGQKFISSCKSIKYPVALGGLAAIPSSPASNAQKIKTTVGLVAEAVEKARDHLKCRPSWGKPADFTLGTTEVQLKPKKGAN